MSVGIALDVLHQREAVFADSTSSTVTLYETNRTYSVVNYSVINYLSCTYFDSKGTVNGSLSFPTVLSFDTVGVAQVDGVQCHVSVGDTCIELNGLPIYAQNVGGVGGRSGEVEQGG